MVPRLSIIIVTLNAEKTIESCLQSIVKQNFTDIVDIKIYELRRD